MLGIAVLPPGTGVAGAVLGRGQIAAQNPSCHGGPFLGVLLEQEWWQKDGVWSSDVSAWGGKEGRQHKALGAPPPTGGA